MAKELVELSGGPGDGERVPIPAGHDAYEFASVVDRAARGTITIGGVTIPAKNMTRERFVRYRRAGRTTSDGVAIFEVEGG